jgi:hypothetical protein
MAANKSRRNNLSKKDRMQGVCYACENASSRLTQTDPDRREWRVQEQYANSSREA